MIVVHTRGGNFHVSRILETS